MGIDVYLEWEGQTKEEQEKQITGYDIATGRFGYLRASYNPTMKKEGETLNKLFPLEYWEKPKCYNFKNNMDLCSHLVKEYILSFSDEDSSNFIYRINWANSLLDFFELAISKQAEKLKPKPRFSY